MLYFVKGVFLSRQGGSVGFGLWAGSVGPRASVGQEVFSLAAAATASSPIHYTLQSTVF